MIKEVKEASEGSDLTFSSLNPTSHLSVLLSGMWEGFMLPRLAREIKWGRESPYLHSISFSLIISFSSFLIYHSLFSVLSVPYLVSETHL